MARAPKTSRKKPAKKTPQYTKGRLDFVGDVEDRQGLYANYARVGLTLHEVVIDFGLSVSSGDVAQLQGARKDAIIPVEQVARLRLPVGVAEGLVNALKDQLARRDEIIRVAGPEDAE